MRQLLSGLFVSGLGLASATTGGPTSVVAFLAVASVQAGLIAGLAGIGGRIAGIAREGRMPRSVAARAWRAPRRAAPFVVAAIAIAGIAAGVGGRVDSTARAGAWGVAIGFNLGAVAVLRLLWVGQARFARDVQATANGARP